MPPAAVGLGVLLAVPRQAESQGLLVVVRPPVGVAAAAAVVQRQRQRQAEIGPAQPPSSPPTATPTRHWWMHPRWEKFLKYTRRENLVQVCGRSLLSPGPYLTADLVH